MARFVPRATAPPKIQRLSNKDWLKGVITSLDDGRTPTNALRDSGNVILQQNGTIRPRPSLVSYGPTPPGTILGEVFEFTVETAGVRTFHMCALINVAGTVKLYQAKGEDASWTVCNGKTYSTSAFGRFLQLGNKVLIMTPTDYLSFLDTATLAVTPFSSLSNPVAPTLTTNTGLTGSNFKVYYAVTSNSTVGETAASAALTVSVLADRDLWNPSTQSLKITRTAVTGENSWNVYCGVSADGAGTPKLYAIATGLDPSLTTFTDDGSYAQDLTRLAPTDNMTQGPKVGRGCVSNGRAFLVGDPNHPYYIWRGGDYGFELDFSPSNGGGYSVIGFGTKDKPVDVKPYRNAKGDAMVMVLAQGTNGSGKRYFVTPETVTYGSSSFTSWDVYEDSGQDGTDSPNAVIIYQNNVYYPSRDGFKTTGTKPQLQNVLSTDVISNTIQGDLSRLNLAAMEKAVGVAFENRLYWALPVGSSTNSEIWVLDLERGGAWMKPWNIAADWLWLYNDNSGVTHFLVLSDNKIYELSYVSLTADNGTAFATSGHSGQIYFSDDGREWGRLIQVVFTLLRPQGTIHFTISGRTEDSPLAQIGQGTFAPVSSRAGWSEPQRGWSNAGSGQLRGWSEIITVPVSFNDATQEVIVEVDEDLQWWSYAWTTTDSGVDYSLSGVTAEFVGIGLKDLT